MICGFRLFTIRALFSLAYTTCETTTSSSKNDHYFHQEWINRNCFQNGSRNNLTRTQRSLVFSFFPPLLAAHSVRQVKYDHFQVLSFLFRRLILSRWCRESNLVFLTLTSALLLFSKMSRVQLRMVLRFRLFFLLYFGDSFIRLSLRRYIYVSDRNSDSHNMSKMLEIAPTKAKKLFLFHLSGSLAFCHRHTS